MALKSTIFKSQLSISNLSTHHYKDYNLTLARHPSENDERMMSRILAFALHANDSLIFGKGLSTNDEPDLWQKTLDGRVQNWIDLGQPDEKRLRQACGKSEQVNIYCYQTATAKSWWETISSKTQRLPHLHVSLLHLDRSTPLENLVERSMQLNCTIEDNEVFLSSDSSNGTASATVRLETLST